MKRLPHLVIGAAAGIVVSVGLTHAPLLLSTSVAAVAALIPDIDYSWPAPPLQKYQRAARPVRVPWEHRGMLHSVFVPCLLGWLVITFLPTDHLLASYIGCAVIAGWTSHVISDSFTLMGCPFFWPLIWNRYRLLPHVIKLHTGAWWFEWPLALGSLATALFLIIRAS